MNESWLSAHVFWTSSLDDLLEQCIAPLVTRSLRERMATAFFFIRYAEHGPHIRLRLRVPTAAARLLLIKRIEQQFAHYQQLRARGQLAGLNQVGDKVRFVPYEPETERYGGTVGLPIAETFFEASSRTTLRWLKTQGLQVAGTRLTSALLLHTVFAAVCFSPATAATWLAQYTDTWLPHDPQGGLSRAAEQQYWAATFANHYQQHRPSLERLVIQQWQRVAAGKPLVPSWLAEYEAAARQADRHYRAVIVDPLQRQAIYASLLHMTNNRLGIANHDEAFVAYLMGSAIQPLIS